MVYLLPFGLQVHNVHTPGKLMACHKDLLQEFTQSHLLCLHHVHPGLMVVFFSATTTTTTKPESGLVFIQTCPKPLCQWPSNLGGVFGPGPVAFFPINLPFSLSSTQASLMLSLVHYTTGYGPTPTNK